MLFLSMAKYGMQNRSGLTHCMYSKLHDVLYIFSSLRNEKALKNFNDANFYLRGNKLINYQQLGLKSKLYLCEVRNPEPVAFFIFNAVYFILYFHCLFASVCLLFTFYHLNQILANRAIAHSRLGDVQEARSDFLMALQSKVEPRHSIIEDLLLCWQVMN